MKKTYLQKLFVFFSLVFVSILSATEFHAQNMFRKINDFDGDGEADFAVTRNENGLKVWYIRQSTNGSRVVQWGLDSDKVTAGDWDGDGKTDLAIWREGYYWVLGSQDGISVVNWGLPTDRVVTC